MQRKWGDSQRQLRVAEELRHALAKIFQEGECRDPALRDTSIAVTEVRMSPDLRNATAFVMPLGGENATEIIAGLKRSSAFLRTPRCSGGYRCGTHPAWCSRWMVPSLRRIGLPPCSRGPK